MSLKNHEAKIIERRTNEAVKKNFMGLHGKLGIIVTELGDEIKSHYDNYNLMRNYYHDKPKEPNVIPKSKPKMYDLFNEEITGWEWADRNEIVHEYSVCTIGISWDSLRYGINMEIVYMEEDKELTLNYDGLVVYKEMNNELLAYAPDIKWEVQVERFYKTAKQREKQRELEEQLIDQQKMNKEKQNWLKQMNSKWGI